MPVIGGAFYVRNLASADSLIGIVPRGLAQRNKGRKTSYFDVSGRPRRAAGNLGKSKGALKHRRQHCLAARAPVSTASPPKTPPARIERHRLKAVNRRSGDATIGR